MAKTYLALGDSYTIGEAVAMHENFPHQLVKNLADKDIFFEAPLIVAQTGWTTAELMDAINQKAIKPPFDLVTLLIGVNNQYRGLDKNEYEKHFDELLNQAIVFAGGNKNHVVVISIPDWGVTPFAADRDRNTISKEIDAFNNINKKISKTHQVHYVDITPGSRLSNADNSLLASDGLHPSANEYHRWTSLLLPIATSLFK